MPQRLFITNYIQTLYYIIPFLIVFFFAVSETN